MLELLIVPRKISTDILVVFKFLLKLVQIFSPLQVNDFVHFTF